MKISFKWMMDDGQFVDEAELPARVEEIRQQSERGGTEGELILTDKDAPEISLGDTLGSLVAAFCLHAVKRLIAGENAEVEYYASEGGVKLAAEGNDVALEQVNGAVRYAREEFIPEAMDCAERFIALYKLIYPDNPGQAKTIKRWEDALAANRAAWVATVAPAA